MRAPAVPGAEGAAKQLTSPKEAMIDRDRGAEVREPGATLCRWGFDCELFWGGASARKRGGLTWQSGWVRDALRLGRA